LTAKDCLAFLLITLVAIAIRWPYFGHPAPDYDEQLYQLAGQQLLQGNLPFVDIWDRKPVGLFLIFAFANLIGGEGVLPYQLLACAAAIAGGALVYALARPLSDRAGATVSASLYILFLTAYCVQVGQSEVFYIPLLLGMAALTLKIFRTRDERQICRFSVAVMLLGGLCLQIKYVVLPQCMFFGCAVLLRQWQIHVTPLKLLRRAVFYMFVGVSPTLAVMLFYAATGHIESFIYANFTSIFDRGHLTGELMTAFRAKVAIMAVPIIACAAVGTAIQLFRRDRQSTAFGLIIAWTCSALIGFLMIGNIYIHYFAPVLPGLLIMAAAAFRISRAGAIMSSFALMTGVLFSNLPFHIWLAEHDRKGFERMVAAAQPFVGPHKPCLYVFDGPTALYRDTHSCLPTAYVYPDHLSNAMEARAIGVDATTEVARILRNRPAVIITASKPVVPAYNPHTARLVNAAVATDYVRIGAYDYNPRTIYVNVRRDLLLHQQTQGGQHHTSAFGKYLSLGSAGLVPTTERLYHS
jgi:hypothetical protein